MERHSEPSGSFPGYHDLRARLNLISRQPSLPSTYLFWGPEGTGKRQIALEWSKSLLFAAGTVSLWALLTTPTLRGL